MFTKLATIMDDTQPSMTVYTTSVIIPAGAASNAQIQMFYNATGIGVSYYECADIAVN